jgi:hypothetical protein
MRDCNDDGNKIIVFCEYYFGIAKQLQLRQ